MNNIQFDALVRLKRMKPETRTCMASRDVFVNGMSMNAAADKHGINFTSVHESCSSILKAIKDCHTFITGEEHR